MNKWVRMQDKITSMRAPAGIMLMLFLCIASVYAVLVGPNLQLYYNYKTKGVITNFDTFVEDGIAAHHFQAVNLYGWVRYDNPMDIIGAHNHVQLRTIVIQDEATKYAILMNNHKMYSVRDAAMTSVYGVIRKMDDDTYAALMASDGDTFAALQADGWTIEPQYYINELESLTDPQAMRGILIFAAVNLSLIILCLIPFLIPHPKTIKTKSKAVRLH